MAKSSPKEALIVSKIQDKVIELSAERLAVILDIPQKGPKCYGRTGYENDVVSRFDIIREMFVKYESDDDLISANLKKEYKLLHNMCQLSVTPQKGSKHKVSEIDILVMYHMSLMECCLLVFSRNSTSTLTKKILILSAQNSYLRTLLI